MVFLYGHQIAISYPIQNTQPDRPLWRTLYWTPMTAINRTAYPRPGARLTRDELSTRYNLTEADLAFVHASARTGPGRLLLARLLKTRRDLGYFPAPNAVHAGTVGHLAAPFGVT